MKAFKAFYLKICNLFFLLIFLSVSLLSQTASTFEEFGLPADTNLNGSDMNGGFNSGLAFFPNNYDSVWDSWTGFAISTMRDDTTEGFFNQFSAITAAGYNSATYAVGYSRVTIHLSGFAAGNTPAGFYVTNSTYAYLNMLNGDFIGKKFGGAGGDDPDWFLLSIVNYLDGLPQDTVCFYLADFRFYDNAEDYIINNWEWVDLSIMGQTDSLVLFLESSDNGMWGMNTPGFFCIDDFTINASAGIFADANMKQLFSVWPNPVYNVLNVSSNQFNENIIFELYNITGKLVLRDNNILNSDFRIDVGHLPKGLYIARISYSDYRCENFKIIVK